MKSIVVYDSASGFTKRYAQWISEDLSADCKQICEVEANMLPQYDCVIFGSHVIVGDIAGRKKFARMCKGLENVVVYVVGASPQGHNPVLNTIAGKIEKSFPQTKGAPQFYFRGGVNYEALPKNEKRALDMLLRFMRLLNSIKPLPPIKNAIAMMSEDCDFSSRESIAPLVEYVKQK